MANQKKYAHVFSGVGFKEAFQIHLIRLLISK